MSLSICFTSLQRITNRNCFSQGFYRHFKKQRKVLNINHESQKVTEG